MTDQNFIDQQEQGHIEARHKARQVVVDEQIQQQLKEHGRQNQQGQSEEALRAQVEQNSKPNKGTALLTLDPSLAQHKSEVIPKITPPNQGLTAQQELALTLGASTPVVTSHTYRIQAHSNNTPLGNQQDFEKSSELGQHHFDLTANERLGLIFQHYSINDPQVQETIQNDARELNHAIEIINRNAELARDQIDQINDALIDFHETIEETSLKHFRTTISQSDLNPQLQKQIEDQQKAKAKAVADEVTANAIHQNRQIEYLRQLDEIHRRKEDEARDITSKEQVEARAKDLPQSTQDLDRVSNVNLTPEAQQLLEARRSQKAFKLGNDGIDKNPPFDNEFNRSGSGGGEGVEFDPMKQKENTNTGTVYAGVAVYDEDGKASDDHTHIGALGAGVKNETIQAGIDKGDNAQNVAVVEGNSDVKTVGPNSLNHIDRSLDRRFAPNNNNK